MAPAILVEQTQNGSHTAVNGRIAKKSNGAATHNLNVLPTEFYSQFLSEEAKNRKPSAIRSLFHLEQRPNVISLLAGKPNSVSFPITSLQFTVRSPIDPSEESVLHVPTDRLDAGLQYGATAGIAAFVKWLEGLQEFSHGRKSGEGWRTSVGSGSQDLIYKALHALVNPGDNVLVESPVYTGVLPILHGLKAELISIDTDDFGINSSSLRSILENWPATKPLPKVLYTVPYGCNPTGMTASIERRREVLELSRKYNFLILEDDPYFYLYYGKAVRPPSYFHLELEQPEVGRVVRFDSLSKIVSAGMRLGFISGPTVILDAIDTHTGSMNLQASSLTQVIALTVLESWGHDGFKVHCERVSEFYRAKRDVFENAMRRHLTGLAEWTSPEAGMFFWIKLLLNDPSSPNQVEEDSGELIRTKALERGVLALPGSVFLPSGGKTPYVRAAFSLLEEDAVDEALRRLASVIRESRSA